MVHGLFGPSPIPMHGAAVDHVPPRSRTQYTSWLCIFARERLTGRSALRLTMAVPCRLPPSDRTRGQAHEAAATADRLRQAFVGDGPPIKQSRI